ncbi:MAG: ArnT family glycosyltransferase [Opitutales bacterium]
MEPAPANSRTPPWKLGAMFLLVALVAARLLTLSWHASILDRYEFRQLQTADSTYWIAHDGWQAAYPLPLFGPPWSVPMEFPTYEVIVAQWHHLTGQPLEQSGRLIGILFLFATLPAVFDLLALAGLSPSRRLVVLSVILSSPVYLFYARTFMIETTALCLAVWFLAAFRRTLQRPTWAWIAATTVLAILAALTKITTFVVFGLPAVALGGYFLLRPSPSGQSARRGRLVFAVLLPAAISLALMWWWVRFSDVVKDSNPFTGFLTARELHRWNFGDWALRSDWSFWIHLQENLVSYQLAEGALAVAVLGWAFAPARARWMAAVGVLGYLSGPLIFANLYHIHDYYYTANALLLTGSAGLLLASCWDDPRLPRGTNWTALSLVFICQFYAYYRGYYSHLRHPAPPPPALATAIRAAVPPDDVVLIYGADWNPLLPYYAQRRAVMVPGERENETDVLEQVLQRLPPRRIAAMVVHGDRLRHRPDFIRTRTAHFGLAPEPFARAGEDDLYLPAAEIPRALASLSGPASAGVQLLVAPDHDAFTTALHLQDAGGLDLTMVSPHPTVLRTRYGYGNGRVLGQLVLNAHAPSELEISPPTGATSIKAVFGLPDEAFAPGKAARTDGITVDIFELQVGGYRRLLFHRDLDPALVAADRGPQTAALVSAQPYTGTLLFRFGTGPRDDPTNDWAYWASIEVR